MSKHVQVLADLTLENHYGDIRITNDEEGNLVVHFPNEAAFFGLRNIRWPFQTGWKTLFQINRAFYQNRQSVAIQVDEHFWMTLGRSRRPHINYLKVGPRYISQSSSLKNSLYVMGVGLGATLVYSLFKKRN